MSDTQQDATRLWNRLGAILSSSQIETEDSSIAVLNEALTQAEQRGMELAAGIAGTLGTYPELNVYNGGPEWYQHGKKIAQAIRAAKEGR